ncbi:uncharacterized protein UHOR_13417 [Ustilago hordei]|uniref:Reverse transcriptase Ty1/copia-type domain-containing protein n=1 Tax=Ustilago hordei TaxID=120017 RepID=I2FPQ9_USTHO|nr:uncharacterized protein UHOR_13417 [Ustilago hordei]
MLQAAYIHNQLAGITHGGIMPLELFFSHRPDLCHICWFGCMAYVILQGSTCSTWLRNHPVVSKHLWPHALWGTYLGFSDKPHGVKGHKVWLPELDCMVVAKDVRFSELEQLGADPQPLHRCVLAGNHELLCSYTWFPQDEVTDEMETGVMTHLSQPMYSHQHTINSNSSSSNISSYSCEWDQMMGDIEEAGEIIIDIDAIATELGVEFNMVQPKRGNMILGLPHDENHENMSPLDMPQSDMTADMYDDVSVLNITHTEPLDLSIDLEYMAFATMCSLAPNPATHIPIVSSHHLDHMAFAATIMDGTALIASGQHLQSADSILLEPLSLNEAKAHNDWLKWQEAMVSEMDSMHKMNVFNLVDILANGRLIGVCWVYKLKLDAQCCATQYKAHLVAQGYAQCQGLDYDQTFSPVICLQTV